MTSNFEPTYLKLLGSGELEERVHVAFEHMRCCHLCPNRCGVNRFETCRGAACGTSEQAIINSHGPHLGEEDPLRGSNGSGTIFFSRCNLRCIFCQNWEISQCGLGQVCTPDEIASMMLELQASECHNINLVSPSHVIAPILAALLIAAREGLRLPIVYNSGGYDSLEALALLDGIVDIYMPDAKYGDSIIAGKYSGIKDYVEVNRAAIKEMHRQVGDLMQDSQGIAMRGLLIRHLILPDGLAGTKEVLSFVRHEISPHTYINLMDQYHPCYRADEDPALNRRIISSEYRTAVKIAQELGLTRLDSHWRGMMQRR